MDQPVGNNNIMIRYLSLIVGFTFLLADGARDLTFEFNYTSSEIQVGADSVGAFNGTIYNISSDTVTIAVVRRINSLPNNWTSSICLGAICYYVTVDSASTQIAPGDSIACKILVWISGSGIGTVQLDLFDLSSDEHLLVDVNFYAGLLALNDESSIPNKFLLLPAFPNPFNPTTTIRFEITSYTRQLSGAEISRNTSLNIYDIRGRVVKTLLSGSINPGYHEIQWNASNYSSGIYFVELVGGKNHQIQKIILVK